MSIKSKTKILIIPLTGGLGNQLFQLAFAIHKKSITSISFVLEQGIANPRLTAGHASLFELRIGDVCLKEYSKTNTPNRLLAKVYGWNLVHGVNNRFNSKKVLLQLGKVLSGILFSLKMRFCCLVFVSRGLGFDPEIACVKSGGIFIGYFQTYRFGIKSDVFEQLKNLVPRNLSSSLMLKLKEVETLRPTLVHLRLTDYINENGFGIPSETYYRKSLNFLKSRGIQSPIWVFSDDLPLARAWFEGLSKEFNFTFFDSDSLSDVENWYLMRKFSAYVIANSSYSWWAAFLRDNQESLVCYPNPWFQSQQSPEDLFPKNWIPISATTECSGKE